jgi:hypothetical protein
MCSIATAALFKNVYKLEPGTSATLSFWILFPWNLKILYGLMSDNFPIAGARRKPYIVVMSLISAVCILFVTIYRGDNY